MTPLAELALRMLPRVWLSLSLDGYGLTKLFCPPNLGDTIPRESRESSSAYFCFCEFMTADPFDSSGTYLRGNSPFISSTCTSSWSPIWALLVTVAFGESISIVLFSFLPLEFFDFLPLFLTYY